MPIFFYTDTNGIKHGPINEQQLKSLATQKVITPQTILETDSGHKGQAGQIRGLFAAEVSPFSPTNPVDSGAATSPVDRASSNRLSDLVAKKNPLTVGIIVLIFVLALIILISRSGTTHLGTKTTETATPLGTKTFDVVDMGKLTEDQLADYFVISATSRFLFGHADLHSVGFLEQYKDIRSINEKKYKQTIELYELLYYERLATSREIEKAISLAVAECEKNGAKASNFDSWKRRSEW